MVEISPEQPVHLESAAYSVSDQGLMTLAAFLLSAGVWYRSPKEDLPILPDDDLKPLGLSDWRLVDAEPSKRFNPYEPMFTEFLNDASIIDDPSKFHRRLGELIWTAFKSRKSLDLAKAVMNGTASPDALVRICALISAFEIFSYTFDDWGRKLTQFNFSDGETTSTLASMLLSRIFRVAISAVNPPQPPQPPQVSKQASPGLMLIHGTNFPPNRPIWSVPGIGPLFMHIANFRTDIYGRADYYRWEGGYSDYAREVASLNFNDWIQRRTLDKIDAVTHSHGGNVLMAATHLGLSFRKIVFLSCPVRWQQYQPRLNSIAQAQSVRIRFDFVILADRSAQRFPQNTIPERILPFWFVSHSATTLPATWQSNALDQYIR
jgi:hypothetical protein